MATKIAYGTRPRKLARQAKPNGPEAAVLQSDGRHDDSRPEQEHEKPEIARDIIGTDDRLRITSSSPLPWKSICRLRMHFSAASPKIGTGFLILENVLLTAGHNLYQDQMADSIEVYSGINGDFDSNYGTDVVESSRLRVHANYIGNDAAFDYGIILLNKALGAGSAGVVRMMLFEQLTGLTGVVSGYPANIPISARRNVPNDGSTQWYSKGLLRQTARQLYYDSDTTSGESGGPVLVLTRVGPNQNEWCAVGIHACGVDERGPAGNSATRITRDVISQIREWVPSLAPTA
jgi:V8-like Glu-specific endopeptidase